jgi:hypothetical protein
MTCEFFSVVAIKTAVFWDKTHCTLGYKYRRFGGTCCLHLKSIRNSEDGGSLFRVNFATHLPKYMVRHHKILTCTNNF